MAEAERLTSSERFVALRDQLEAARVTFEAEVVALSRAGLTVRAIAEVCHLSHQGVANIIAKHPGPGLSAPFSRT